MKAEEARKLTDEALEILSLRHALKRLLDVYVRCEAGFPPDIEIRINAKEMAESALNRKNV